MESCHLLHLMTSIQPALLCYVLAAWANISTKKACTTEIEATGSQNLLLWQILWLWLCQTLWWRRLIHFGSKVTSGQRLTVTESHPTVMLSEYSVPHFTRDPSDVKMCQMLVQPHSYRTDDSVHANESWWQMHWEVAWGSWSWCASQKRAADLPKPQDDQTQLCHQRLDRWLDSSKTPSLNTLL